MSTNILWPFVCGPACFLERVVILVRRQLLATVAATGILFVWGIATHVGLHGALDATPVLKTSQEEQVIAAIQEPELALDDGIYMGSRGLLLVVNTLADGNGRWFLRLPAPVDLLWFWLEADDRKHC